MNNISKINMYSQKMKVALPYYETLRKMGSDHEPVFQVSCTFMGMIEVGVGATIKIAKENAASKIVDILDLEHKLRNLKTNVTYSIDSYNASLPNIWENNTKNEYILTLRKTIDEKKEYKNFKVTIVEEIGTFKN